MTLSVRDTIYYCRLFLQTINEALDCSQNALGVTLGPLHGAFGLWTEYCRRVDEHRSHGGRGVFGVETHDAATFGES